MCDVIKICHIVVSMKFGNPGNVDLKLFYAIFRQADSMQSKG